MLAFRTYCYEHQVVSAFNEVHRLFNNMEFQYAIQNKREFSFSSIQINNFPKPVEGPDILGVLRKLMSGAVKIDVREVKYGWLKGGGIKTIFDPKKDDMTIYISTKYIKKLNRLDLIESIVHEVIHLVDYHANNMTFGHGGEKGDKKLKVESAPYWIAQLARDMVKRGYN